MSLYTASRIAALFALLTVAPATFADEHQHHPQHPPHNMIVFGLDEVFASHLVYKAPHNYQVELALTLPPDVLAAYQTARRAAPDDTFIWLLDPMDIGAIGAEERLTGKLFRLDAADQRTDVATVTLDKSQFRIVFFQELPLSLSAPTRP